MAGTRAPQSPPGNTTGRSAASCEQTRTAEVMNTHSHTHVHMSYHDMGRGQRRDPCVPETPGRR